MKQELKRIKFDLSESELCYIYSADLESREKDEKRDPNFTGYSEIKLICNYRLRKNLKEWLNNRSIKYSFNNLNARLTISAAENDITDLYLTFDFKNAKQT